MSNSEWARDQAVGAKVEQKWTREADDSATLERGLRANIEENKRLRRALERYGRHEPTCLSMRAIVTNSTILEQSGWRCTCGYEDALRGESDRG